MKKADNQSRNGKKSKDNFLPNSNLTGESKAEARLAFRSIAVKKQPVLGSDRDFERVVFVQFKSG